MALPDAAAAAAPAPAAPGGDPERELRRYLLLLASLAATVTYAAGLDPPGGTWVESDGKVAVAGDPILRATNHPRYLAFYYSNANAFAASLVIILLLLVNDDKDLPGLLRSVQEWLQKRVGGLSVLRLVMVLDMLALMAAYTAGSCRDMLSTVYALALVLALSAYVGIHIIFKGQQQGSGRQPPAAASAPTPADLKKLEQRRKVLMLLAIFAATITYDAGLNPPGGFWDHTDTDNGLQHRPGEVVLNHKHGGRFTVFFFCNTTAFISSLLTVVLLLDKKLTPSASFRLRALSAVVVVTLVTLVAAYSAGSCRNTTTTAYTVTLVAVVLVCIFLAAAGTKFIDGLLKCLLPGQGTLPTTQNARLGNRQSNREKIRSLVLLLGTLAASITYQAGLSPPGGVWLENLQAGSHGQGHNAGDPILLSTDHKRYNTFFYCNSTALVASIVVIVLVQIENLAEHAWVLHMAMIFDLLGMMGAYIAGSTRTFASTMRILFMAAAFLVYVTAHALLSLAKKSSNPGSSSLENSSNQQDAERKETELKKRRKRLLLFAILVASISYQAGLSPPGGFWITTDHGEQGGGHRHSVGSPILEDMYPHRYQAFFYCNAMSFMASMALIILLQFEKTFHPGKRCYSLYACMGLGMVVLMGAFAAGSARRVKTSVYAIVLVGAVLCFMFLVARSIALASSSNGANSNTAASAAAPVAEGNTAATHDHSSSNGTASASEQAPAATHHQPLSNGTASAPAANEMTAGIISLRQPALHRRPSSNSTNGRTASASASASAAANNNEDNTAAENNRHNHKYVMLLAMLAASVTYKAGLDPPGGVWPDGYGAAAGNPVLHDSNLHRYHIFFYSNSISFMASIIIIFLLLTNELPKKENSQLLRAINPVVTLDMIMLLVAYASGSCRTMPMSLYVIVMGIAVVAYIVFMVFLRRTTMSLEEHNGANGRHEQVRV